MEPCRVPPPLKCIFFAEFHSTKGRQITFQVPSDVISCQEFHKVSSFVLPKLEVMGKLIKLNLPDIKIMGFPIGLQHSKYTRNTYFFNMCLVTDNISEVDCLYEPLVQKMAQYLTTLETESGFLWDELTRTRLPKIMLKIFNDLNEKRNCDLFINERCTIYLKLSTLNAKKPIQIGPYMVPVLVRNVPRPAELEDMDVLCRSIYPWIDGGRSVSQIARAVRVDPDLVARALNFLYQYGLVVLTPVFQYRNVYITTAALHSLYTDKELAEDCLKFCALPEVTPRFYDAFRLMCSLRGGLTLKEWCIREDPRRFGVNERKLIGFGLVKGLLRKIHGFPVYVGKEDLKEELERDCDGKTSLEEVAIKHHLSLRQLETSIARNDRLAIVWK